ncbi:hypothetical protein BMT54_05375 [Pasteurellaceae bacterium 15-036681]|nr:hypothetical protein BMT54_05375 [Pasteurellaceae bacterium 15-036681]
MKNKILISTLAFTFSTFAIADDNQKVNDRLNDQRIQAESSVTHIRNQSHVQSNSVQDVKKNESSTLSITKEELAKHPDLVVRALIPAVAQGNADNVKLLYPIYQQIPEQFKDSTLTQWSQAILAKQQGDNSQAIKLYRQILAENNDIHPVRLQLAVALFENNEMEASEDQFQKLRAEKMAPQINNIIDQYIQAINKRDRWTFSGGLTYLNDPNINNAPKAGTQYGNWIAPKRESAEGIGFNFNIGKKWSWGNGFYNELRLNTNGKYYWDNKKYNEVTGRASVGLGFQNAKYNIELLPFMEQTLYAGGSAQSDTLKRFSKGSGVALESHYWLNPQWQLNANYEYAEQRYTARKHLNGNYHFVSTGLAYFPKATQYWFANVNYNRTSTRDKDDSFFRRGISLGWGQEWDKGLSTRLSFNIAEKQYKAPMPIFGITQRNKEWGMQASVWHRAVHYWGITPRLTYNFTRTRSNHVFYSYDKHRIFLDFSKQF